MTKPKVLFVCTHNSARSQMAEAYLKHLVGDRMEVSSAGFQPAPLNPLAVEVMAEEGLDISGNTSQSVFKLFQEGRLFDYVITVCEDSREASCPIFPGVTRRLHWGFPDPAAVTGDHQAQLMQVRQIRDQIKHKVRLWSEEILSA
ncbi:MAG: arsenate reductase ArsC [Desulfarculus sp.]|nr:arsenate reductase ArsC [Desulfarculus sp.]